MDQKLIYLASGSPRRRELLTQIGVRFETLAVDVDERARAGEAPEDLVQRLALAKARAGAATLGARRDQALVLGADTVVVVAGDMLGKPRDRADGLEMLDRLSGAWHSVLSGVACICGAEHSVALSLSRVQMRDIEAHEAQAYWDSGEPGDKAGAYAIQGLGGAFVRQLEGSYSGVMGLPLHETTGLLVRFGWSLFGAGASEASA